MHESVVYSVSKRLASLSEVTGFGVEEVERARRFHRPGHAVLVVDLLLSAAALAALTQLDLHLVWWQAVALTPLAVDLALSALGLPAAGWRFRHDRAWELTSQGTAAWAVDRAKAIAVGAVLSVLALAPLFVLAHLLRDHWVWIAAPTAAALVFVLGFLAPVVLEPVFNRFAPLADRELGRRLHELAARAGTPVREILVAVASRRTRRRNAYVSGIGPTRRVVLWDTLLQAPSSQIAVVVAHELGHRARRHVAAATLLGMAAAAAFVVLLRIVRPHPQPRDSALVLLLALAAELVSAPLGAALSRRFERSADAFSLRLTDDLEAFSALHHDLAVANLSQLDPSKWLYYWAFTHPTPSERLASVEVTLDRQQN